MRHEHEAIGTLARPPAARRFGLRDAMLLVAATAAGLAADRGLRLESWEGLAGLGNPPEGGWTWEATVDSLTRAAMATAPLVASWTLAVLASAARGPRPRRRLTRAPGLAAGLALVPILLACAAMAAGMRWRHGEINPEILLIVLGAGMGLAVLASWTSLVVARRWRPEPTWADRAGRCSGAYWIASSALILSEIATIAR